MQEEKTRYSLIDGIRGLTIISMVLYHFLYDVFIVYDKNPLWASSFWIQFWQQTICWTFIFISGFVWTWGRKGNFRRGILLNLYGLIISLVTVNLVPGEAIWFGILNFIGCAVLLMFPLEKVLKKVSPAWGFAVSLLLFILCRRIPEGVWGVKGVFQLYLPASLYTTRILTPLGFPFKGFYSADYFPVLPWILLYICGYFGSRMFLKNDSLQRAARLNIPVLSSIGRNTIWIYLFHQPVNMLVCCLLFGF